MELLVRLVQFLLSLCILVVFHELGHYFAARAFRTRVDKFYIFFNPWFSLFKRKIGHTEFGIGWIPLGGYAKIAGMVDESLDRKQLASAPKPYEFRAKPAWQRLIIVSGGVFVNLLLAWVIYSMQLFVEGEQYVATEDIRYGIAPDSVGEAAGFRAGDQLVTIAGSPVARYDDFYARMLLSPGASVEVMRDGSLTSIEIPIELTSAMVQGHVVIRPRIPFVVGSVIKGSAADRAGFQPGDSLVAVNGFSRRYFDEFRVETLSHREDSMRVDVMRGAALVSLTVQVPSEGLIGISPVSEASRFFRVRTHKYGVFEAFLAGGSRGWHVLANYARSIRLIFRPGSGAHQSVGGFISIGKIFPGVWDWSAFWSLTAFLSLALALMNFLPIPALDGGHAVFILYEMVTRRRPGERFLIRAQMVGFALLVTLLLYANINDVIRLFE